MHKIILVLSLFMFFSPVFAQGEMICYDMDDENVKQNQDGTTSNDDYDSEDSDYYYNELIEPEYGCDQSPAFLNRGNINPNESDYGYGSTDGTY